MVTEDTRREEKSLRMAQMALIYMMVGISRCIDDITKLIHGSSRCAAMKNDRGFIPEVNSYIHTQGLTTSSAQAIRSARYSI